MHQALLIDEILQIVLDSCPESSTLSRVARTCQAWKEPALDRLWKRLTSVAPLLMLIPGLHCVNGIYVLESSASPDLHFLRSYASRVKHVAHRQKIQVDSTVVELLASCGEGSSRIFRNLASVQLSLTNCHTLCLPLSSGRLESVELDLGFKNDTFQTSNEAACRYLSSVERASPGLTSLSLRGSASQQLLATIAPLFSLKTLSLRLGATLTAETIAAIAAFPFLAELELHASHIQPEASIFYSENTACFPSLQKLNVRGHSAFIGKLIQIIQSDCLCSLHVDIEPVTKTDDAWISLFSAIRDRSKNTLLDLTIEHHIAIEDYTPSNDTSGNPSTLASDTIFNNLLRFDILHPLSNHHNLRRLIFDTTPPIAIRDQDFDQVCRWWPNLEHLDIGSLPTFDSRWAPKTSFIGLSLLSQRLPLLQSLVYPIDSAGVTSEVVAKCTTNPKNTLKRVTLTSLTPPDVTITVACLNRLFPALREIDGMAEHEEQWCDIRSKVFTAAKL